LQPLALLLGPHRADGQNLGAGHLASWPGEADGHFAQGQAVQLTEDDADLGFDVGFVRKIPVAALLKTISNLGHGTNKPDYKISLQGSISTIRCSD
jgi:hypothetical protein